MTIERKLLGTSPSGGATDVADVFSIDLWDNIGQSNTVNSGIDSTDSDVMIWAKQRDGTGDHYLADTVRGITKYLRTNNANMESTNSSVFASTSSTGYTVGGILGGATPSYVGWQFKKQKKFFDIVTWNGNSVSGRQISHSLNSPVGMIIVKRTNANGQGWAVYHRSASYTLRTGYYNTYNAGSSVYSLHSTGAPNSGASSWNNTDATSTHFTLGNAAKVNQTGGTYVAYLFADNSTEDAEEQMIKCGYYHGNASADGPIVNLGWEPQWLLIRPKSTNNWLIYDNMRGVPRANSSIYNSGKSMELYPNLNNAETFDGNNPNKVDFTATGFQIKSASATHNKTNDAKGHLFMAIRAPMMVEPEAATDVFAVSTEAAFSSDRLVSAGFAVDAAISAQTGSSGAPHMTSRLTAGTFLSPDETSAEGTGNYWLYDESLGVKGTNTQYGSVTTVWNMWKKAKGFMDVVAFTGNATAGRAIPHSLGVAPEIVLLKSRSSVQNWYFLNASTGGNFLLNTSSIDQGQPQSYWGDGTNYVAPTASNFTIGSRGQVNASNVGYIAYLFATLAGISKVGSYTGNGSSQTIDCGFSAGARFILIKRTNASGNWMVYDSARGIVAGNDPHLSLNSNTAQVTTDDSIDPDNSGFIVNQVSATNINVSSSTYIFYAIA